MLYGRVLNHLVKLVDKHAPDLDQTGRSIHRDNEIIRAVVIFRRVGVHGLGTLLVVSVLSVLARSILILLLFAHHRIHTLVPVPVRLGTVSTFTVTASSLTLWGEIILRGCGRIALVGKGRPG